MYSVRSRRALVGTLNTSFSQLLSTLTDADKVIKQASLMLNAVDQKVKSPTSEAKGSNERF